MDNNKLTQLWEINFNSEKELGLFIAPLSGLCLSIVLTEMLMQFE